MHVNIYTRAGMETWWPGGLYGAPPFALAVPTFLIIAGYAVDMGTAARGLGFRQHMLRLRRLAIPFVIWNAITLAVVNEPRQSNWDILVQLFTGTWHLYFIFVLLQLLFLYALIAPALDRGHVNTVTWAAIAITVAAFAASEILLWSRLAVGASFEIFARQLFPFWIGFFAVGIWWRRRGSIPLRISWKILVAVALAWALLSFDLAMENRTFGFTSRKQLLLGGLPFELLGALTLLVLLEGLDRKRSRTIDVLASCAPFTFGIYLSHVAIMVLLFRGLLETGINTAHWSQVPLLAVAVFLISLVATRFIRSYVGGGETRGRRRARSRATPPRS